MNPFVELVNFIWLVLVLIYACAESLFRKVFPIEKKRLKDKCVLITGGGGGLGKQLAISFAKCGARVVLWDIDTESNERTASLIKAMNREAFAYTCDCKCDIQVKETAARVNNEIGHVDILVNNAGVLNAKSLAHITSEEIKNTFETNVYSSFWTVKEFLPAMKEHKEGHIVTLSSTAGMNGAPYLSAYSASKYALIGLHESLALELREEGFSNIHVTCVCPNFINTGMPVKPKTNHPGLIPILQPTEVAKAVVNAVRRNQEMIVLPKVLSIVNVKRMLPLRACLAIYDYLGIGVVPKSSTRTKSSSLTLRSTILKK